jgi:hypothetical protein
MRKKEEKSLVTSPNVDFVSVFSRSLSNVRDDIRENPYLAEAIKVLPVGGYRSAIGCFWNAVIDDLRNKIIYRSLSLFNKSIQLRREIKSYEDFQDFVNDDELIEGAYRIGVITWEAHRILRHAKETRHIFDGHPKSSDPSPIKVLAMMEDCIKYVLSIENPPQIIDIDEYIATMNEPSFSRNMVAVENALGDLPETYKNELANRLLTAYTVRESSTTLKGNIEFIMPILWNVLPKEIKIQLIRHIDTIIRKGDSEIINDGFKFTRLCDGEKYLSTFARKYRLQPVIEELADNLDTWSVENNCVSFLEEYAPYIPQELLEKYVSAIVHTYIGTTGSSTMYGRTDFFANGASVKIPGMIDVFDDNAADAFVNSILTSDVFPYRLRNPAKLRRLRFLTQIVLDRVSANFKKKKLLELILDEKKEKEFFSLLKKGET